MKKFMRFAAVLMLAMFGLFTLGCKPEDDSDNGGGNDYEPVKVVTFEPQAIMQTSAVCGGEVTKLIEDVELEELGVCWSTKNNPTVRDSHQSTANWSEPFMCTLTDLDLDTKYYVRAYARKGEDCYYGNEESFTTLPILGGPSVPIVFTMFVTDIGSSYAFVRGSVAGDGGKKVTERGVCWSDSHTTPTIGDSHASNGSDLGDYSVTIVGLAPNTTYYARAYAINEVGVGYGGVVSFKTKGNDGGGGGSSGSHNGHEYIDLGLPSGILWATSNVGGQFAWGETSIKNNYSWATYKYCEGDGWTLTKYCYNSQNGYHGFVDNLTVLLPEDDAATVNWGGNWRIPTYEEWEELQMNTTQAFSYLEDEGWGFRFTSSNGNTLFLPADGYFIGSSHYYSGGIGNYWSSSLDPNYTEHAWSFCFNVNIDDIDDTNASWTGRYPGFSVRAVCSGHRN